MNEAKSQGDTDIPVCGIASEQTGMSVSRRNLPHWHREGSIYWVTSRLADSLPQENLKKLKWEKEDWLRKNPEPRSETQRQDYHMRFSERIQEWLDAGYRSCALRFPGVRDIVRICLTRFDGNRLKIHAAVIMPNHVHAILEPLSGSELPVLLKGIKGTSARLVNKQFCRFGNFWMDESYDRIVRDQREYVRFCSYIRDNPRKAGLLSDQYWLFERRK